MHPTRSRDLGEIYTVVSNKTKKLNKNYEIFDENDFFIFNSIFILDQELPWILKHIAESSTGTILFRKIFIYCFGGDLYEFDISKNTYRRFNKSNKKAQQLTLNARYMLIQKYSK